ncbi:MAG: type II toxin-antitoxin system VapC family toxin [Gammaproteobacteria bacterium]|nr:type II toxin-antitoxin system VapC family toxin [Gammaproteobacteria bacterium]
MCSVTLPWYLEDERTEFTDSLLVSLADIEAWVPALWRIEFTNALLTAMRRGRIDEDWFAESIEHAERLGLRIDDTPVALSRISKLAFAGNLTAYDAAYLELAGRRRLRLATSDKELRRAASEIGVKLVD